METEEEFWLKKRGRLPFITYHGAGCRATANIEIPLTEIAERFNKDTLIIAGKPWKKENTR